MAALKAVPAHTVKNCWVACKVLTMQQMQDLETGERHNYWSNNTATAPTAGVSQQDIEDLSALLSNLGKSLTLEGHNSVQMLDVVDLIDMELEREVFDPPAVDMVDMSEEEQVEEDEEPMGLLEGEEHAITLREDGDVDEREPPPSLTLSQAKEVSEKLFAFVSENCALVTQAGTSMHADYVAMADTLRFAIQRMLTSSNTRQASMLQDAICAYTLSRGLPENRYRTTLGFDTPQN